MRGTRSLALALGLVLAGLSPACGSDKPSAPAAAGGRGGSSGNSHPGGSKAAAAAGETSAGVAAGAAAGEGGAGSDLPPIGDVAGAPPGEGGAPPIVPPVCDPSASWANPISLAGITTPDADEQLLTMTHDELTLVFSRGDKLFVADRADATVDFGTPVELTLPLGYTHTLGLALSANGRLLVLVSKDSKTFAEVSREARSGAFGALPNTARFETLNDGAIFTGATFSAPVLSANDESFFYTQRMSTDSYVFRARGQSSFQDPKRQDGVTLGAHDGKAKLSRSIAADERALFVFDEALGHAVGLWSASATGAFTQLVDFPGLASVFTNTGCSRLYGTRQVDASLDIVIETPK